MARLRVLYQDPYFVVIDKPSGFHVHPPEDGRHKISNAVNCLSLLSRQLNLYLYPVHRLDRATSGVLIFALSSEVASLLSQQFADRHIRKTYIAMVRGWLPEGPTQIDYPLKDLVKDSVKDLGKGSSDSLKPQPQPQSKEAITSFESIARVELPIPLGRYSTTRYSLVRVEPETGRMHQIRRHFAHLSHPLVGDTIYGDGVHNRFFREKWGVQQLYLKASQLSFTHPVSHQVVTFNSKWNHIWHRVFDLFGVCPRL